MNHRYHLAHSRDIKKNGWNNRCPSCGQRKFSPYIDSHTGKPIDEKHCGRCCRERSCAYHMPPSEWFKEHKAPLLSPQGGKTSQQRPWLPREQYVELMRQRKKEARMACLLDPLRDTRSYPLPLRVLPLSQRESADSSIAEEVTKKNCPSLRGTSETEQSEVERRGSENITAYLSHMSALCNKTRSDKNHLAQWLATQFPKEQVAEVLARYRTGSTRDGRIIYWQIDHRGQVRAGKVMAYDPDGHRRKEGNGNVCWVHSIKIDGIRFDEMLAPQCLFGEHLINGNDDENENWYPLRPSGSSPLKRDSAYITDNEVADELTKKNCPSLRGTSETEQSEVERRGSSLNLAESEKTALIMSLVCPDRVWLATGGKANFKEQMLWSLLGHEVAVYPDADALRDWEQRIHQFNRELGHRLYIPTGYYNLMNHEQPRSEGWDLADVVLRLP